MDPEDPSARTTKRIPRHFSERPIRIGPYRILEEIGEGGMGNVYLAEQEKPVHRRVAIKIIRLGMDTADVIARFEGERQALAMMNHPNIAKVFDAGATDQGRPYFVMEHVPGIPITAYCDQNRLSTQERLELFIPVCEAIHHAHMKGVIHRDVKPSNVLVAMQDGKPVPKVIDFGVAKAVEHRLTEHTVFTEQGVLIGTPEYMSPEQAEMTGLNVDTATDVYSLGVLLYELLSGALPFDPEELRKAGLESIHRLIREVDPPKPSTRITTLGRRATEIAKCRRTELRSLKRQLSGELDWITQRAIEKDRSRRYPSASELGADIARHLHNEPVLARKPSASYQLKKLVSRHRVEAAFSGMVVALLIGFGILMSALYTRALRAERQTAIEAETATQVSDFLVDMFDVADPSVAQGDTITVREVLDRGSERIESELGDRPEIKARLLDTMGRVYTGLGLYEVAAPQHEEALRLREQTLGDEALETGRSLHSLAKTYSKQGRYDEVFPLLERAIEIKKKHLGSNDPDVATSITALAATYDDKMQYVEAESLYHVAIAAFEASGTSGGERHAVAVMDLANLYRDLARYEEAESLYVAALHIQEEELGPNHPDVARTLHNMAYFYYSINKFKECEEAFRRSMAIGEKTLGPEHEDVMRTKGTLALLYMDLGRLEEAENLVRETLDQAQTTLGPDHITVAWGYNNLGRVLYMQGRYPECEEAIRRSVELKEKILGKDNSDFAMSLGNLGAVIQEQGRNEEALPLYLRALDIQEKVVGRENPQTIRTVGNLGNLYRDIQQYEKAEAYYQRALADYEATVGLEHSGVAGVQENLGLLRAHQGRIAAADSLFTAALAIRTKVQGEGSPPVAICYYNWGSAMAQANQRARALELLALAMDNGFDNEVMVEDQSLRSLHGTPEFEVLLDRMRANREKKASE